MVVVILGMLIGIVAIGLSIRALVKKRGWSLLGGLLGSVPILLVGFVVLWVAAGYPVTKT